MELIGYKNEVVNLPYRVNKALEGKYFIGHTPALILFRDSNMWAGLINPQNSGVDLFLNTFTVSNYTDTPFQTQIWLVNAPGRGILSSDVSASNRAIFPPHKPKVRLEYGDNACFPDGVSLFTRMAEANSTVVGNYYGKIVVPPGEAVVALLCSPGYRRVCAEVAFGWWEDRGLWPGPPR